MLRLHSKISTRLLRFFQWGRVLFYRILSVNNYSGQVIRKQPLLLLGEGKISFVGSPQIGYFPSPFYLSTYAHIEARRETARVEISSGVIINNNFVAIAEHTSIVIGERVLIGFSVEIYDSDFHGLRISERNLSLPENSHAVKIQNDVFIGSNVKILKGVTIGAGSVIANGSIVVESIPENVIAAGIPAKVVRHLE